MKICLTGHNGFIGKHISDFFKHKYSISKINLREIKNKSDFNKNFFLSKFDKADVIINCAASLNPKSENDFFINQLLPKLIANNIDAYLEDCVLIHLSTINVLIEDRKDMYTKSKMIAEKNLKDTNSIIVRLPLIYEKTNNQIVNNGNFKQLFNYLNFRLPIYPMIYPGQIYEPLTTDKLLNFFQHLFLNKNIDQKYFNLCGEYKKNLFDIFEEIAKQQNKIPIKLNLNRLLPKFLTQYFLKKNGFFQQLSNIDNTNIKENKYILK